MYRIFGALLALLMLVSCAPAASTLTPSVNATTLTPTETSTLTATPFSPTETSTLTATPAPLQLFDIQMFDEQNGWGNATNTFFSAVWILHTQDGGQTWQNVSPTESILIQSTCFLDGQTAWVVDTRWQDKRLFTLFRTNDGGSTWDEFLVPFDYPTLQFRTPDLGWAAGNNDGVYQTEDGGQTWARFVMPDFVSSHLRRNIWFRDQSLAWVGGMSPYKGTIPLYISHDNGSTWQEIGIKIPEDKPIAVPDGTFYGKPIFLSDNLIYQSAYYRASDNGVSSYPVWVLLVTRDGGDTWSINPMDESWEGEIDFITQQDAFAICGSQLCITHDGAQTWQMLKSNLDFGYTEGHNIAIEFVSITTGWAVEFDHGVWKVYKTVDGGITWKMMNTTITP